MESADVSLGLVSGGILRLFGGFGSTPFPHFPHLVFELIPRNLTLRLVCNGTLSQRK